MGAVPVEIRIARESDHDELFEAFERIVNAQDGFPQDPPLTRSEFYDYWVAHSSVVSIARFNGHLVGGYYVKANFVGRAAHIANAGYFVLMPYRGNGVGWSMVEHSMKEARRVGFDALQFNLVFASNSARAMYLKLGFQEIGRIPSAVDGEDAFIYWRSLADVEP